MCIYTHTYFPNYSYLPDPIKSNLQDLKNYVNSCIVGCYIIGNQQPPVYVLNLSPS